MKNFDPETIKKMIAKLKKALEKIEAKKKVVPREEEGGSTQGRVIGTLIAIDDLIKVDVGVLDENQHILDVKMYDVPIDVNFDVFSNQLKEEAFKNKIFEKYKIQIKKK